MDKYGHRIVQLALGLLSGLIFFPLLHEVLALVVAAGIHALFGSPLFFQLIRLAIHSPVHATILAETLAGIQPQGLAVAHLPGQILHQILPTWFLEPPATTDGWIMAVFTPNSTVLSILIARGVTETLLLFLGLVLTRTSSSGNNFWHTLKNAPLRYALGWLLGFFIVIQAASSIGRLMFSSRAVLRDTGIGVGLSLFFQLDAVHYQWWMEMGLPILGSVVLTSIALGAAWLFSRTFDVWVHVSVPQRVSLMQQAPFLVAMALALVGIFVSQCYPYPAPQVAHVTFTPTPTPTFVIIPPTPPSTSVNPTPTLSLTATPTPSPVPTLRLQATPLPTASPTPPGPTRVEIRRRDGKFILLVNDQPTYIKGMNYNVNYTMLPEEIKRKRHTRDFRIMRDTGVNAIIGWGVYDETTLHVAHQFGIGVFMPFDLDTHGAYTNPRYREQIKHNFRAYIKRFQHLPALWGWNPGGDELLHRLDTEAHRTPNVLQVTSDFLLELAQEAYGLDPYHISIIKEPRDWYVPYIEDSVRRARLATPSLEPSTFFVFGINVYGQPAGIATVLQSTQRHVERQVNVPVVIGEFAPFGLTRTERPTHYVTLWNIIQQTSSLGGFAYVYGPDQPNPQAPNPYDPLRLLVNEFSLVDVEGNPVDGSLDALATQWREASPRQSHSFPHE